MRQLIEIWEDQKQFNKQVRQPPMSISDQEEHTKYFVMCVVSELDEILRCVNWKHHRRKPVPLNVQRVREELTDLFKYCLCLMQTWDMEPEHLVEEYWRKSAVVRQRFNEEYLQSLDCDSVVIDIDEVLCDFSDGMLRWLINNRVVSCSRTLTQRCVDLLGSRTYLSSESLQIAPELWMDFKDSFRLEGGLKALPPMPGAKKMLQRFKERGLNIILLTSRPVDQYPHVVADTLSWLNKNNLPYNFVWFAKNKREEVLKAGNRNRILFAVDDDPKFVHQFASLEIETYYFRPNKDWLPHTSAHECIKPISSLEEIP